MSTTINGDSPAFPRTRANYENCSATNDGMTLRDYLAGQALAGIAGTAMMGRPDDWPTERCAAYAYECADAMLSARMAKANP